MKTTLKLESAEQKTSKGGRPYITFKTSMGVMSCFESIALKELMKNLGNEISVEVEERNGFKNLTKFYEVISGNLHPEEFDMTEKKEDKFAEARASKDQAIYTSYAKDLFIEMFHQGTKDAEKVMEEAIKLIKTARDGFK